MFPANPSRNVVLPSQSFTFGIITPPVRLWDHGPRLSSLTFKSISFANTLAAITPSRAFRCIGRRTLENAYTKLQDWQRILEERMSKMHKSSSAEFVI